MRGVCGCYRRAERRVWVVVVADVVVGVGG
jgi:hypothetical protein